MQAVPILGTVFPNGYQACPDFVSYFVNKANYRLKLENEFWN